MRIHQQTLLLHRAALQAVELSESQFTGTASEWAATTVASASIEIASS